MHGNTNCAVQSMSNDDMKCVIPHGLVAKKQNKRTNALYKSHTFFPVYKVWGHLFTAVPPWKRSQHSRHLHGCHTALLISSPAVEQKQTSQTVRAKVRGSDSCFHSNLQQCYSEKIWHETELEGITHRHVCISSHVSFGNWIHQLRMK